MSFKHRFYTATAAALIITALISSAGCSSLPLLERGDGILRDPAAGSAYADAPVCFIPAAVGEEYARLKTNKTTMIFYEIAGLDPLLWLTNDPDGAGTVFYPTDMDLPELSDFNARKLIIYRPESVISPVLAEIDDAEFIGRVVAHFTDGQVSPYMALSDEYYQLRFESPDYPGIYYCLIYVEYGGAAYIMDRSTKRCVEAGDLFADYTGFGSEAAE